MNSKGQVVFYGMMLAVIIMVLALALAPVVKDFTDSARNTTTNIGGQGLDCSNASISDYDQGACMIVDLTLPYFIGCLVFIAGVVIIAKIVFE